MQKWECSQCGYIYDPEKGDPSNGVEGGTLFEDVPDIWLCPICGAPRSYFTEAD